MMVPARIVAFSIMSDPDRYKRRCMKIGTLPELIGARNSPLAGTDELGKRSAYVKIELKNIYVQI